MQETWIQFLGQEDTLEKEMATHSRILAWETPWAEEPGRLCTSMGMQESDSTEQLSKNTYREICKYFYCINSGRNITVY